MRCPKCEADEVDRNKDDFFECRACHIQFSTSEIHRQEDSELVVLDAGGADIFKAVVLKGKGSGEFPLDDQVAHAVTALQEAQARRQ